MNVLLNNFKKETEARGDEYKSAFNKVLSSGWYILGEEVESFEQKFSKYLGTKHCIGVANGLEALQISLLALGIGQGDEVITTPFSFAATTLAILAVSAKPVFIDVDENGQIDLNLLEKKIKKKTKAVIPVDLYGMSCDLNKLQSICKKHNIFLIEDAAQAHGSVFKNKKLGTFGDVGCFSFYPTKNLGAMGDGGAIVTYNSKIAKAIYEIRNYGRKDKLLHSRYGLNSRLDEIQAGILLVKLKYLDKDNEKRSNIASKYMNNLKGLKHIKILEYNKMDIANFHLFVVKCEKRDELKKYLEKKGIQTAIHYPILIPDQPFMKSFKHKTYNSTKAKKLANKILTLPCNPWLIPDEINYICGNIKKFYKSYE